MDFSWIEFFMFSLAVFRLTRLIVYDQITEWMRNPFMDEYEEKNIEGKTEVYYLPKVGGVRGWIGALLSCYWCSGIWVSAALFILRNYVQDFYYPIVAVLAAAGLAALVETWIHSKDMG